MGWRTSDGEEGGVAGRQCANYGLCEADIDNRGAAVRVRYDGDEIGRDVGGRVGGPRGGGGGSDGEGGDGLGEADVEEGCGGAGFPEAERTVERAGEDRLADSEDGECRDGFCVAEERARITAVLMRLLVSAVRMWQ